MDPKLGKRIVVSATTTEIKAQIASLSSGATDAIAALIAEARADGENHALEVLQDEAESAEQAERRPDFARHEKRWESAAFVAATEGAEGVAALGKSEAAIALYCAAYEDAARETVLARVERQREEEGRPLSE